MKVVAVGRDRRVQSLLMGDLILGFDDYDWVDT